MTKPFTYQSLITSHSHAGSDALSAHSQSKCGAYNQPDEGDYEAFGFAHRWVRVRCELTEYDHFLAGPQYAAQSIANHGTDAIPDNSPDACSHKRPNTRES